MNVKLVVVQGKPEGKEIPLRNAKFLVGRGTECHLRPNSELISRHHCMFVMNESQVVLRDLGSTNGTLVNGERVTGEVPIYHEDLIQVGPLGFRIMIEHVAVPVEKRLIPAESAAQPVASSVPAKAESLAVANTGEQDIAKWLVAGGTSPVPAADPGGIDEDVMLNTKVELGDGHDTQHELPVAPPGQTGSAEPAGDDITLESGRKVKLGNAREKIEKTREDTSNAAAELLRRMMDRRSKK